MRQFYDKVGYAITTEVRPSVWEDKIVERTYFGELVNPGFRNQTVPDQVHQDIKLDSDIEIIADPFAIEHFSRIRYITYMKERWTVIGVKERYPRLHLTIGGIYHGPTVENV